MAFQGVYIRLPEELVEFLDAIAPHVGEVYPARRGRTSVLLSLVRGDKWNHIVDSNPEVAKAYDRLADLLMGIDHE
jgi:hypothetical protein